MKNKILKATNYVAGLGFIVSGCCLDSDTWLPLILCGVCLAWLVLANWEVIRS